MNEKMLPFPFEFYIKNENGKMMFLDTVEKVLKENLQSENSFGCRIRDCHTHVGSERHLADFIEAELLFHNSYYNKGFAAITADKILDWLEEESTIHEVLLVGYENFSELYLCETVDILNKLGKKNIKAKYCVYENIGKTTEIRKLEGLLKEGFFSPSTKVVFIIPISTTFTTLQKLTTAFQQKIQALKFAMPLQENILNIALIVIGEEDKFYWKKENEQQGVLRLADSLYSSLSQKMVHYFSYIQSKWYPLQACPLCFPDIIGKKYIEEKPLFGVNRSSVVPMLQLENWKNPKPYFPMEIESNVNDLEKVISLSKYMYQRHLQRNGNHFEYYFDTETFFEAEREGVENWLENKVKIKTKEEDKDRIIYDFLVAPRHYSNAGFVHAVNNWVFHGTARIFYFDVQKEFRGNINAKYSDFQRYVANIKGSGQKSLIRFHFVDDTIYSSGNFKRAQSLISTLAGKSDNECKVELYASCILLLGRSSKDTQRFLLGNEENFFEYVHLSISPMRNHEDACTLCLLEKNFRRIKKAAATNEINRACISTIANHNLELVQDIKIPLEEPKLELRLRLIILHLLTMRLSNKYTLSSKQDEPISRESEEQVYDMLCKMWEVLPKVLKKMMRKEAEACDFEEAVKCAFIKVITRPFYSFHIRQKQAAFRFCLVKMDELLNEPNSSKVNKSIVTVLMNGLTDMDANYLIRQENMIKILSLVDDIAYFKAVKKLTTLSQGDTKNLLLEALLTTGNEVTFFGGKAQTWDLDIHIKQWLSLYIENNQILISGLKKWDNFILTVGADGYGLSNFRLCLEWNGIKENEEQNKLYGQYQKIIKNLPNKKNRDRYELDFSALEISINQLLNTKNAFLFVDDSEHANILQDGMDKYILLNDSPEGKKILYKNSMQDKLDRYLNGTIDKIDLGNSLIIPFGQKYFLIKIVAYDEEVKKDTAKEIMSLYLYVPVEHNFIKKPNQMTEECHKDLVAALPLLMRIKLLLTLRGQFERLMERDFHNIIKLVRNEQMEKALSISKAVGHGASVLSCCPDLNGIIDIVSKPINELSNEKNEPEIKRLFDRQIQLISNNFISSIYRSIHTGEINCNVAEEIWKCSLDVWDKPEYMIFLHSYLKDRTNVPKYEFWAPRKSRGQVKIQICLQMQKDETWVIRYLHRVHSVGSSSFKIIVLLACNVAYHSVKENVLQMDVYREGEYLCFRNLWDRFEYEWNNKSNASTLCDEVREQMEIHPSKRGRKAGISLWSLKKYCDALNPGKEDNFIIDTTEESEKKYFVVKMRVLSDLMN